jgi:hypothetical protein
MLVETSIANFRHAWGINEASISRRVDFGGSVTIPTHTLQFISVDNFFEAYFYKVVAVDFGEITFSSKQDAAIPVTFRAILDTTKAVGAQIGYIVRGTTSSSNLIMRLSVPKIKTNMLWSSVIVEHVHTHLKCKVTVT